LLHVIAPHLCVEYATMTYLTGYMFHFALQAG
jgi:hypothetical protein